MRILWCTLFASVVGFAQAPPELGQGWQAEFELAARQLTALAEATPAEKFSWRPAEGVRSISEVYVHTALGNFGLLAGAAGPKPPADVRGDAESKVTEKAAVITLLKRSFAAVREAYPKLDRAKKVKFLGQESNAENVLLRLLVHNHEHMGQSIAYARMVGVKPPWSK